MKSTSHPQSATSLPRAPRDEVGSRSTRYLIMMGVRVLCFILMVFVQPFGWWTWIFGVGAIFLPYVAVVMANVGQDSKTVGAVPPERALEAPADRRLESPSVIQVEETHQIEPPSQDPEPSQGTEPPSQDTEPPSQDPEP